MLLCSEKHLGSFRENNNVSKNVIANGLKYTRPEKELFCKHTAFPGVARVSGEEKEKEKSVHAIMNLWHQVIFKVAAWNLRTNNIGMFL